MILHPAEQGTDEWRAARAGLPTASRFKEIVTPAKLQPSKSCDGYLYELLAEWRLGRPLEDEGASIWTDRGTSMEDEARAWYSWEAECGRIDGGRVVRVGLCLMDDGKAGCSPDALVGEDGGLEIKCPSAGVHARYVDRPDDLYADYRMQVQGGLLVTGRKWWDMLSFCPSFPEVRRRFEPEPDVQAALASGLAAFVARLEEAKARWLARGIGPLASIPRLHAEPPSMDELEQMIG